MLTDLQNFLEAQQIKTSPEDLAYYGRDWTTYFDINPQAIIFPTSVEQVQKLVQWAQQKKIALVPSGGRTGLSGGACATQGEIVVSFEKMNRILDFNATDQVVTCEPGVVTETLQNFALSKNLFFPIDFAARGSSHIGGNIATNAGGIRVIRYGMIRNWIVGLQVVTGQGDILNLNQGLIKNATGPNFLSHFIGSEGIFGFITQAQIQLTSPPPVSSTFLLQVADLSSLMAVYQAFRYQTQLQAFEFFSQLALDKVLSHKKIAPPFAQASPYYLVIEVETPSTLEVDKSLELFEQLLESGAVTDGALAQGSDQSRLFWSYRENISECLAPFNPYKNDIAVTVSKVPAFLSEAESMIKDSYQDFEVVWFGHIGDGNLHINILRPNQLSKEAFVAACQLVDKKLFVLIQKFQGAISAEHGVGLTKKPFLYLSRSPQEINILKQLKQIYDPHGIINPGKVIDCP